MAASKDNPIAISKQLLSLGFHYYRGNQRPKVGDRLYSEVHDRYGSISAITKSVSSKYEITWDSGRKMGYDFNDLQTLGIKYHRTAGES